MAISQFNKPINNNEKKIEFLFCVQIDWFLLENYYSNNSKLMEKIIFLDLLIDFLFNLMFLIFISQGFWCLGEWKWKTQENWVFSEFYVKN